MREKWLQKVNRVVVKFGTGILTNAHRQPDLEKMGRLVHQLADLHRSGWEIVLVSSGAVGSGMGALGFSSRPSELSDLQACAAVGQSRLMANYDDLFSAHGITVAQVLLCHDDLRHHDRHLNARNTLMTLLEHRVIPIINENDAVSYTELKFGDNDRLSALVASLIPADLLILLTTADGLVRGFQTPQQELLSVVEEINDSILELAKGTASATAVGGMITKLEAAKIATRSGIPMIIASGTASDTLQRIRNREDVGTLFLPNSAKLRSRKRWIAFFHHPKGSVYVDDGAKQALRLSGKSLLLPGITKCDGQFSSGEVVRICDGEGTEFARGISRFHAHEIQFQTAKESEIIHRDNLVLL